jgi:hypothetical protein
VLFEGGNHDKFLVLVFSERQSYSRTSKKSVWGNLIG